MNHYLSNGVKEIPAQYLEVVGGSDILAGMLINRGVSVEELEGFLDWQEYKPTNPEELPNMAQAVEIIKNVIEKGHRICVYGDYDVDGVTSTVLLVSVLRLLNADVIYKVPDRFKEGYGLNEQVIKEMPNKNVKLILTCDCGISNDQEISLARELGMEVVVTDHHHLPEELPDADAIVTPQMLPSDHRAKHVPGVGAAYFVAKALMATYGREEEVEQFIDLVALGAVADVVPLRGENRYFVQRGLAEICQLQRPGILALLDVANIVAENITEEDFGFKIAPCINAAGRMETAEYAVELLLSTEMITAQKWASTLNELNKQRKQRGKEMLQQAESMLPNENPGSIVLFHPQWHQGIIGITAGRLCEKYNVPVILMTLKEDGETVVGSARSVDGVHILNQLKKCGQHLSGYGGHAGAAGLSLRRDKLTLFMKVCERVLTDSAASISEDQSVQYDLQLPLGEVDINLYHQLRYLAPFGEGWPKPLFYCSEVSVVSARPTTSPEHLRLVLRHGQKTTLAMYFWGAGCEVYQGDLLYYININRWNNKEELQLLVDSLIATPRRLSTEIEDQKKLQQVFDYRGWHELGDNIPQFTNALYYMEGFPLKSFDKQTSDRYSITTVENLVLFTCPPSSGVLREMIAVSEAENLVLAYSQITSVSVEDCIKQVMTHLVHVYRNKGGKTSVYEMARITGQTELLMMEIIRVLQKNNLLRVQTKEQGNLTVKPKQGGKIKKVSKAAKELLNESNAYRRYMNTVKPEVLLKNIVTS